MNGCSSGSINNFTSKGTCIPLQSHENTGTVLDDNDGALDTGQPGHHRPWILIPSWCANGIFKSDWNNCERPRKQNNDVGHIISESGNHCKRRRRNNDLCRNSNLERLLRSEIRQCDFCARDVLWSPSLERQHLFSTTRNPSPNATSLKSITESLPQFTERHLPSSTPLPCSFCTSQNGENPWCGAFYCRRECQIRGEGSVTSESTNSVETSESATSSSFPNLIPPKLFFCRNRFFHGVQPEIKQSITNERHDLIREITESISAIEKRFQNICGYDDSSETAMQIFGAEECALLLATIISCTRPDWISEIMQANKLSVSSLQHISSDEESLIEEMWVMSKSHRSLWELLQKYNSAKIDNEKQSVAGDASSGSAVATTPQHISANTFPSYQTFLLCYLDIKRFCLLRVNAPNHPLVSYATKTIISPQALSEKQRDLALDFLKCPWFFPKPTETENDTTQSTVLRWRNATHFAHWISTPASTATGDDAESKRVKTFLRKSYFAYSPWMFRQMRHSCCPTLALAIRDSPQKGGGGGEQSPVESLAWLALHDVPSGESSISKLDSVEDDMQSRSTELRRLLGKNFVCSCIRCQLELSKTASSDAEVCLRGECTPNGGSNTLSRYQVKRLADLAMQQGLFDDASALYNSVLLTHPRDGDVLHSRAASYLGMASSLPYADQGHCQGHFMEAQRLWEEAGSIDATHQQIAIQRKKQLLYKTSTVAKEKEGEFYSDVDNVIFSSLLSGKCFVTGDSTPILSRKECQKVIDAAEEHASKNEKEGWTTSRHYAVPTTDIPLHELTELQSWFYQIWKETIRPLLRRQFKLSCLSTDANHQHRDMFLHDVFVVRYDADRQRYLPPHYDESTHSFIIALNSNFKGGGTFIHSLGKTLTPSAGGMLSFCGGELLHSGDPVVEGLRYIIAAFCYVDLVDSSTIEYTARHTPNSIDQENPSFQTHKQSKLKDLFSVDGSSKSERTADSVQEKSQQAFSFGFNF